MHLARLTLLLAQGRIALSLVPTRQDFRDAIVTLRYYLGLSDEQARFDKFEGHSNKEVAEMLGISVKTAMSHREHVMTKLGVNRTELIRFALRAGVIRT